MTKKSNNIEAEKNELNLLIGGGITYEVVVTSLRSAKGLLGILKKREKVTEKRTFRIEEPTLAVLDLIAAEQIDIVINEDVLKSEYAIAEAKKLTGENAKRMARIIAIATLGQDFIKPVQLGSRVKYQTDTKALDELSGILFHNLKPSMLVQLTFMVNTMSNLGDFTNSIRLMSASRTTMPIRIEAKDEG